MIRLFLILCSMSVFAQQQIVPKEFSRNQKELFEELTQAVSAPCCNNGIPVAFHMSPMANQIRDQISSAILEGKSKKQIMEMLENETYGSGGQKIIFTVPPKTAVGYLAYIVPALAALIGIIFVIAYRNHRPEKEELSDETLLNTYKNVIQDRVGH